MHPLFAKLLSLPAILNLQRHLAGATKDFEKLRLAAAPGLDINARCAEARTTALTAKTPQAVAAWIRTESERTGVHVVEQIIAAERQSLRETAIEEARALISAAAIEVREELEAKRAEILGQDELRSKQLGELCESTAALSSIDRKLESIEGDVLPNIESRSSLAVSALATVAGVQL